MASKKIAIIAVVVVVALVASGMYAFLGTNGGKANDTGTLNVTDALGKNVTLSSTPKKVVSASPSTTELLYALGVNGSIVGVTDYCDYPLNTEGKSPKQLFSSIGGYYDPSVEKIAGLKPDLVILDAGVPADVSMTPTLDSLGIKYMTLYSGANVTQIQENMKLMGKVFGAKSVAESLISNMDSRYSAISLAVGSQVNKSSVMILVSYGTEIMVACSQTFVSDTITDAGGVNAFANLSGYATVSKEAIVQADPDIIIATGSMVPTGVSAQEFLDQIQNDVLLKSTSAVVHGKVFIVMDQAESCFLRQGIRVVQATMIMADIMYPSIFGVTIPNLLANNYTSYLPADDINIVTITDALGNKVTLYSKPTSVVSCSPSTTELLYATGANASIIGVTDYCDYPLNAEGKMPKEVHSSIGGFYSPSFEKIAGLNPDLVLLDAGVKKQKDLIPQLDSVGIKHVSLYSGKNVTEIRNNIIFMGKIFDKEATANALISEMNAKLSAITDAVSNVTSKPKVMVMVSWSPSIYVNGGNTFINDIIIAAGGVNCFGNASGYATVSKESIVQANPDVIIVASSMIPGLTSQQVLDQIKGDSLLQDTNAVKNNKVFVIQDQAESCFLRQGVRVVQATQLLADMLYPSIFNTTIPNILNNNYVNYLPASWNNSTTAARTVMTTEETR